MRYGKCKINKIIDQIVIAARMSGKDVVEFDVKFEHQVEMIREQYKLIDHRSSALPEYTTEIIIDFIDKQLTYKELMSKYHCSERTMKTLLHGAALVDDRVKDEVWLRTRR